MPFYRGLTLDEIGGDGLRWQEREESAAAARQAFGDLGFAPPAEPPAPARAGATGSCGSRHGPALWASWVTEHSPSLRFLAAEQVVELNPLDAERLGLHTGDEVEVSANGDDRHGHRARSAAASHAAPPRCSRARRRTTPTCSSTEHQP